MDDYTPEMIDSSQSNASRWQKRLFSVGLVFTFCVFIIFVSITFYQITRVSDRISAGPILQDSVIYNAYTKVLQDEKSFEISLFLLESQAMKKRYHNANMILSSQIYIKYLGFLTGMVLSILGSLFVLGKFREYPVKVTSESQIVKDFKIDIQTTSPGIILVLIGAIVMMTTILSQTTLEVNDIPIYIKGSTDTLDYPNGVTENPPPKKGSIIEDSKRLLNE